MSELIKPFFHWGSITTDCLNIVRKCDKCQRMDKTNPKHNTMQAREVVFIPFVRVAIDIVGPFPMAKVGFRFLLTGIDLATRWPEAIAIRTATANVIVTQLTNIFSRCGFPTAITSDNGTLFTGKTFSRWQKQKGIQHV